MAGHQYLFLGCDGEVRDNKKNATRTLSLYFEDERETDDFEKTISEGNIKKGLDEKREEKRRVDELFK